MSTIIIFIIVLAVLIFVHELGHFIAAKATGMRVDEFALGFPPKIFSKKIGETEYALNAIPFGGYVKIFGEDPDEESISGEDSNRSFVNKPKWKQAIVLLSGVFGNLVLAWLLISIGFMSGLPTSTSADLPISEPNLVITNVLPDSPADEEGLKAGDVITGIRSGDVIWDSERIDSVDRAQKIIAAGRTVVIFYERGSEVGRAELSPEEGIVEGKRAIGIGLDMVGTAKLGLLSSFWEGAKMTISLTAAIAVGLATFIGQAFTGGADLSQVAGPVGIASLVGDASALGFVYLMSFTAFISIHLVIINLIPFPALDGGRLLFVLIEKIKGSRINPKIANTINAVGFALLILLMIVITVSDVVKLF